MFSKLITFAALAAGIAAAPLPRRSFNKSLSGWGGHESLNGFDNFYGVDNYSGYLHEVNVVPHEELVCHQKEIVIVQQRLLVIKEWAKKIITELVCDVETQTLVFEQWHGSLGHFSADIRHLEGSHPIGYDFKITEHFPKLWEDKYEDWGFTGYDYGKNYYTPSGYNWKDDSSHSSVHDAWVVSQGLQYEYSEPVKVDYSYHAPSYAPSYHEPEHTYSSEYHAPEYHTPEYHAPSYTTEYKPEYTPAPSYSPAPWPSESPASSASAESVSASPSAAATDASAAPSAAATDAASSAAAPSASA
ncbi:hypothetical protein DL96DRAFT_1823742 [Flagelloscypha sp. PMI_526]|nr:hypothetical protein DL96DRAFT_1823742 [Flagelloscypha sp. PMI_526]